MKGVSPLLAAVILVSLVISISIFVGSSLSSIVSSQKEKTTTLQKCTDAGITIQDVGCSNNILSVVILNTGNTQLSNFTVYAKINGVMIINSSAENSKTLLSPGEGTVLKAYVSQSGRVESIQVYSATCPGVFAEISNETIEVTC